MRTALTLSTLLCAAAASQIPGKPSPVLVADLLFVIGDTGIASCFDALTGKELWKERIGGKLMASPAALGSALLLRSDSKLYRIESR